MDLIFSSLFGIIYTLVCVGCFIGGVRMIIYGNNLSTQTVGLLITLLGILGILVLF
jgi:hypothetical protein